MGDTAIGAGGANDAAELQADPVLNVSERKLNSIVQSVK